MLLLTKYNDIISTVTLTCDAILGHATTGDPEILLHALLDGKR